MWEGQKTGVGLKLSFLTPGNSALALNVSRQLKNKALELHPPSLAHIFHSGIPFGVLTEPTPNRRISSTLPKRPSGR